MAFCGKCGAYIAEGSNVCPACGKRVGETDAGKKTDQNSGTASQASSEKYARTQRGSDKSRESGWQYSGGDKQNRRSAAGANENRSHGEERDCSGANTDSGLISGPFPLISALSYFSFLFLIPYLLRNDCEYARFHANQGLVLLICSAIINIAGDNVPLVGWMITAAGWVFTVACIIMGVSNVLHKRFRELPIIGKIRLLK